METLSPDIALILLCVSALAGLVDAMAGGGGLLTVPALLWAGLPPAQALATNKLQGSFGTLAATLAFWRSGLLDPRILAPAVVCTFVGAASGAFLVQRLDPGLLAALIPLLLVGFALYFLLSPRVTDLDARARISPPAFALLVGTSVGFYDGFFGPGTGSFFALACVGLLGQGLRRATAHTKVLNFTSNVAALLAFLWGGQILWSVGLLMAVGQFAGAWTGSRLALRHGARLIRPLLVLVSLAISVRLILDA